MEALATPGIPVGARVRQRRVNVRWEYGRTHVLGTEIRNHQIIYCRTEKKKKKKKMPCPWFQRQESPENPPGTQ